MPSFTHQDVRLEYRVDGPDHAPPLVLSNSLGTDLAMWAPQLDLLASQFRVIRYDTRGHGASSVPAGPYTLDQLGGDVVALLDHLGIARAHVCGLSMGGLTAMWLAVHAPDRVGRVVLANTGAKIGEAAFWNARIDAIEREAAGDAATAASDDASGDASDHANDAPMRGTARSAGLPASVVDGVVDRWFTRRFQSLSPDRVAPVRAMLSATSVAGYVANCAAVRDADLRAALASIAAPTLVVAGTHDPSTPPQLGRDIADAVPGATLVELDAAHLSNIEQAAAFNAAVLRFLTDDAVTEPARIAIGETMRRSVLGDAHVDRSARNRTAFNGEFLDFITRTAWGETWTRPGLPRHTRSLLTISMMVALNRPDELRLHLHAARNNGVSRDDIKEVLLQAAIYCGVPAANSAFHLATQVFAEQDAGDVR